MDGLQALKSPLAFLDAQTCGLLQYPKNVDFGFLFLGHVDADCLARQARE
jgi:hypothetical protein